MLIGVPSLGRSRASSASASVHLGTCGHPTCTVQTATYWCHFGYYVCLGCAEDENRRTWRNRPDGEPFCTPIPHHSPAPSQSHPRQTLRRSTSPDADDN